MSNLTIKYATYANAFPPQPIKIKPGGWGGSPEKMADGSEPQPWHCLPFVEASTYGLELLYQFENECHVVNDGGLVRFEWDYAGEPGGEVTGGEFVTFYPKEASRFYSFGTRIDVQAPPGHVVRTEPHPRFFTDDTGTVPLAMIGHVQTEWWAKKLFIIFRAPAPGRRHIFRKGEAYAQLIFVPQRAGYDLVRMDPAEEARRRELEQAIDEAPVEIADNVWRNPAGYAFGNHYKILARAFGRDGTAGVAEVARQAVERHRQVQPHDKSVPEALALGHQRLGEGNYDEAKTVFSHVLERDPRNAEALSHMGICVACTGQPVLGIEMLTQAAALEPRTPVYHNNLGEMFRLLGRHSEAEAAFRTSIGLKPNDPGILSVYALTLAEVGRAPEGLRACQAALSMAPRAAILPFRMGYILAKLGRVEEARTHFRNALALDPGLAEAQQALCELESGTKYKGKEPRA